MVVKVQILGGGCPKCRELADRTEQAASELGIEIEMEKVTDLNAIMGFGVMVTPGLVVDGAVKVQGKVPSVEDVKEMLGSSGSGCCDDETGCCDGGTGCCGDEGEKAAGGRTPVSGCCEGADGRCEETQDCCDVEERTCDDCCCS